MAFSGDPFQNGVIRISAEDNASKTLTGIGDQLDKLSIAATAGSLSFKGLNTVINNQLGKNLTTLSKTVTKTATSFTDLVKSGNLFTKFGKESNKVVQTTVESQKLLGSGAEKVNKAVIAQEKILKAQNSQLAIWGEKLAKVDLFLDKVQGGLIALKALDAVTKAVRDINFELSGLNESLITMQKQGFDISGINQLKDLKDVMTGLDPAKAQDFVTSAITQFNNFNKSLQEVNTIAGFQTQAELQKFGQTLRTQVTDELKNAVSSTDALAASYQVLSAGFKAGAESSQVMTSAFKLATVGGADTFQTVDLLSKTLRAYRLNAKDAAEVSGVLFKIVEQGITTVPELTNRFGQTASVAKAAKIELKDLGAAVALLTRKGVSTDTALNQIEALSRALIEGDANKELAKYGITFDSNTVKAKGLQVALEDLNTALKGNQTALRSLFPDSQAFAAATALAGENTKEFGEIVQKVSEDVIGKLEEQFQFKLDNDQILKFQQIINKVSDLLIQIGKTLFDSGLFTQGLDLIQNFIRGIDNLNRSFPGLIVGVLKAQLAFKGLGFAVSTVIGTLIKLAGFYLGWRLITLKIFGDIGRVVNVFKNWKEETANGKDAFQILGKALREFLNIGKKVEEQQKDLADSTKKATSAINDQTAAVNRGTASAVKSEVADAVDDVTPSTGFKTVDLAKERFDNTKKSIQAFFKDNFGEGGTVPKGLEQLQKTSREGFQNIIKDVKDKSKAALDSVKGLLTGTKDLYKSLLGKDGKLTALLTTDIKIDKAKLKKSAKEGLSAADAIIAERLLNNEKVREKLGKVFAKGQGGVTKFGEALKNLGKILLRLGGIILGFLGTVGRLALVFAPGAALITALIATGVAAFKLRSSLNDAREVTAKYTDDMVKIPSRTRQIWDWFKGIGKGAKDSAAAFGQWSKLTPIFKGLVDGISGLAKGLFDLWKQLPMAQGFLKVMTAIGKALYLPIEGYKKLAATLNYKINVEPYEALAEAIEIADRQQRALIDSVTRFDKIMASSDFSAIGGENGENLTRINELRAKGFDMTKAEYEELKKLFKLENERNKRKLKDIEEQKKKDEEMLVYYQNQKSQYEKFDKAGESLPLEKQSEQFRKAAAEVDSYKEKVDTAATALDNASRAEAARNKQMEIGNSLFENRDLLASGVDPQIALNEKKFEQNRKKLISSLEDIDEIIKLSGDKTSEEITEAKLQLNNNATEFVNQISEAVEGKFITADEALKRLTENLNDNVKASLDPTLIQEIFNKIEELRAQAIEERYSKFKSALERQTNLLKSYNSTIFRFSFEREAQLNKIEEKAADLRVKEAKEKYDLALDLYKRYGDRYLEELKDAENEKTLAELDAQNVRFANFEKDVERRERRLRILSQKTLKLSELDVYGGKEDVESLNKKTFKEQIAQIDELTKNQKARIELIKKFGGDTGEELNKLYDLQIEKAKAVVEENKRLLQVQIEGINVQVEKLDLEFRKVDLTNQRILSAYNLQSQALEKQTELAQTRKDLITRAYDIAINSTKSAKEQRKLELERIDIETNFLNFRQKKELEMFDLKMKQQKLEEDIQLAQLETGQKRLELELKIAELKDKQVQIDPTKTKEEKEISKLNLEAAQLAVTSGEQQIKNTKELIELNRQNREEDRKLLLEKQEADRFDLKAQRAAATKTTRDDIAIGREARDRARRLGAGGFGQRDDGRTGDSNTDFGLPYFEMSGAQALEKLQGQYKGQRGLSSLGKYQPKNNLNGLGIQLTNTRDIDTKQVGVGTIDQSKNIKLDAPITIQVNASGVEEKDMKKMGEQINAHLIKVLDEVNRRIV